MLLVNAGWRTGEWVLLVNAGWRTGEWVLLLNAGRRVGAVGERWLENG